MNWQPRIEEITEKTLIGKRMMLSLADNKTAELWRSFMPQRKQIMDTKDGNLFSAQVYPDHYFNQFNANTFFEKWSAVEVHSADAIPTGLDVLVIPAGLYAMFTFKGCSTDTAIYNYIFTRWIPSSNYILDERPHFEVLGVRYKNDDPESEENIYIPIKQKQ